MRFRYLAGPCFLALLAVGCADPEVAKLRHLEKANAHMAKQQYDEAVLEYRNALKKDPRLGDARFGLAEALAKTGRHLEAAREYVRAAEVLPDRVDVQIKAGGILLAAQEFERSQQAAQRALDKDPKNVDAQLLLAHSLAGLKDLPGAVRELEEAISLAPEDSRPYTSLGGFRLAAGERKQAEVAYRRAVEIDPKSVTARIALGYFYWGSNDRKAAAAQLTEAVTIDPRDQLANRVLALFHLTAGQMAEAEPPLLRLAEANDPDATLIVAEHYARTRRLAEARAMLERLKGTARTRNLAIVQLARLDHGDGQIERAHAALDQELQENPKNAELLSVKARFLLTERRLVEADQFARRAVEANKDNAGAHYVLGVVNMERGLSDQAAASFRETLRINPRAAGAELQLSRLSLAAGDTEDALRRAEAARKAQPGNVDAKLGVASALLGRREIARAEAELKPLLTQFPDSPAVRALYGRALAARGEVAGAAREFDRALAIDPGYVPALDARVSIDLRQKKLADARARLARGIAVDSHDANVLLLAGRFEAAAGNAAGAESHLRRAIEANPSLLAAYGALGQLYYRVNRLDEARAEFEKLATLRADPVGPKTMVGMIYDLQKRPGDAIKVYEEVVKAGGRIAVAANNLAWHYAEKGEQLDHALELVRTAKQQMPDSHEVDDTLGWVYYKRGMADLAIPALERSVKAAPEVVMYQYHLGLAYAKAGRPQDARRTLERALKLQPDFSGAPEARATLASLTQS